MCPHAQVFKHLSERQLPTATCPTGILKVQINGWCVGSDVQHGLTKPGFMILIRDDVAAGAKKALSVWFQDEIVLPLLREGREKAGWVPGTPIPPELQGLYWQDAQMDQNQVLKMDGRGEAFAMQEKLLVNQ